MAGILPAVADKCIDFAEEGKRRTTLGGFLRHGQSACVRVRSSVWTRADGRLGPLDERVYREVGNVNRTEAALKQR